jgi:hypothetical protein
VVTFLLIVALLIVVAVLVGFVVGYNRIRAADVRVDEALGGIDVQLTRRASLIPALVTLVPLWSRDHSRTPLIPVPHHSHTPNAPKPQVSVGFGFASMASEHAV